ncbi:MAG: hypothetical protein DRI37_09680 [Chloroflexi bacterium]|nr:MAG: hypothetical protein DRI37_09680 [Chloroflexota bacterium]
MDSKCSNRIFSIIRGVPNRTYSFLAVAGLLTEPQAGTVGKPALSPRRDRPELPPNIEKIQKFVNSTLPRIIEKIRARIYLNAELERKLTLKVQSMGNIVQGNHR